MQVEIDYHMELYERVNGTILVKKFITDNRLLS